MFLLASLWSPLDLCQFSISTLIWCSADVFATMGSNKYAYVCTQWKAREREVYAYSKTESRRGQESTMCDFTRLSDIRLTFILIFVGSCMRVNMWTCVCVCVDLFRLILPIFIFRRRIQWILFDTWTYVEFLWAAPSPRSLYSVRCVSVSFWFHFISFHFQFIPFWHFVGALLLMLRAHTLH